MRTMQRRGGSLRKGFGMKTSSILILSPPIFDCTIDLVDSAVLMRNDLDHQVFLPDNQKLEVNLGTGQIRTNWK